MRSFRPLIPGILMVVALLSACGRAEPAAPSAVRPVLVVQAGRAAGQETSYAGEIRARAEATLAFRVAGHVVERHVDVGDAVRAGQVLAVLDAGDLQAQARAAAAQLAAAEAHLGRARADQARFAALGTERLVSRSAVDAQNAAATAAQGEVNAARATLQLARNQAAYARLRAPVDGVIAARHVESGQVVAPGQPVFTLAGTGRREVLFAVAEPEIARIAPGHPVEVEVWSRPGHRWAGRVREVAPAADPASRTYAIRAGIDAPADAFELGQSARVHVAGAASGPAAVQVPLAALQRGPDGASVFVVEPGTSTLRLQAVRTGPFGPDGVPVLRGLAAGEWVVAAGGHLLQAGEKVRAVDRENRPVRP